MKKVVKNLLLITVMTVLCMAVAVMASAYVGECGHKMEMCDQSDPDCESDGFTKYYCEICGTVENDVIPAYGHNMHLSFYDNCEEGIAFYNCEKCGHSEERIIEGKSHNYLGYPSDEELACFCGERDFWIGCSDCNYTENHMTFIGTAEHAWYPDYGEGGSYSCTEGGTLCYWCENCGEDKWEYTAPIGSHLWDDYPSEEELSSFCGVRNYEFWCERCGAYGNESFTGTKEHNICWFSNNDATCTEDGTKVAVCEDCESGELEYAVDEGSALGHDYNAWIDLSDVSCTQDGISVRSCKRCALIDVEKEKAYGHDDNNGDGKCDECKVVLESSGTVTPDAPHTEHTYSEWVTEGTLSYRQCTECGHIEIKFVTADGDIEIEYPNQSEQPDCSFEVEAVEGEGFVLIEEKVAEGIGAEFEVLKAFDINLKNSDGIHVQPDGSVKVKLPLDWEKEGNYKVYRDNGDGTFTDMNAVRQGSHMVFDTDHFSVYIIVEEAASTPDDITPEAPEENKKEDNVFSFLRDFLNNLLDFFRKLFGIA